MALLHKGANKTSHHKDELHVKTERDPIQWLHISKLHHPEIGLDPLLQDDQPISAVQNSCKTMQPMQKIHTNE